MSRSERMVTHLRRGDRPATERLRVEAPGEWLPRWTAGEPLSR